jgi:CTP:molybdopterin cytidylyltransferase MocA
MGRFKPLLPLGLGQTKEQNVLGPNIMELNIMGQNVLERQISLFQRPEIQDIQVVTGHRVEEIKRVTGAMGIKTVFNPDYAEGMFSSVLAGLRSLDSSTCDAFFVMPVDIPLVAPGTISLLLDAWKKNEPAVVYPKFQGKRGHPPLISMAIRDKILDWPGLQGLRGALECVEDLAMDVETPDRYILMDMDYPEDYEKIQLFLNSSE